MTTRNIVLEASKDALSYITGSPVSTISEILSTIRPKWTKPNFFLDWELKNWPQIYPKEISKCITIYNRGKKLIIPMVVLFDNTHAKLELSHIVFNREKETFNLQKELIAKTDQILRYYQRFIRFSKREYSNEDLLRLTDFSQSSGGLVLELQAVKYEFNIRTNLSLDARIKNTYSTLREELHSSDKLEDLRHSPLANPLGINFLLFTADGRMVISSRSRRVLVRPNELGPSSSGDLNYLDLPTTSQLKLNNFPHLRETFEELGLHPEDISDTEITFLGLTRELIRGGKPEMFFTAKTFLSESEFRKRRMRAKDKYESKKLIFFDFGQLSSVQLITEQEKHGFLSRVDTLIDSYSKNWSIPLWGNIALWIQHRLA